MSDISLYMHEYFTLSLLEMYEMNINIVQKQQEKKQKKL